MLSKQRLARRSSWRKSLACTGRLETPLRNCCHAICGPVTVKSHCTCQQHRFADLLSFVPDVLPRRLSQNRSAEVYSGMHGRAIERRVQDAGRERKKPHVSAPSREPLLLLSSVSHQSLAQLPFCDSLLLVNKYFYHGKLHF